MARNRWKNMDFIGKSASFCDLLDVDKNQHYASYKEAYLNRIINPFLRTLLSEMTQI